MAHTDQDLLDQANKLALQTSETLQQIRGFLTGLHGSHVALTLTVDACLVAAHSMVQTAVLEGAIPPRDVEKTVRTRLDHILSQPDSFHQRRPDGSFDPVGQRLS